MKESKIERLKSKFGNKENKTSRNYNALDVGVERYVSLAEAISTYKKAFYVALTTTFILVFVCIYLFNSKTVYPYVVKVNNENGQVISSEVLKNEGIVLEEKEIEYFIRKFVNDSRIVTLDKKYFTNTLKNLSYFLTSGTQKKLEEIYSNEQLNSFFDNKNTREVEIISINKVPSAKNSYLVRWKEKVYNSSGKLIERTTMSSIIKITTIVPNLEQIPMNPLGIIISDFNITKEN